MGRHRIWIQLDRSIKFALGRRPIKVMKHANEAVRRVRFGRRVVQLQGFVNQCVSFRRRKETHRVGSPQFHIGFGKTWVQFDGFPEVFKAFSYFVSPPFPIIIAFEIERVRFRIGTLLLSQ